MIIEYLVMNGYICAWPLYSQLVLQLYAIIKSQLVREQKDLNINLIN